MILNDFCILIVWVVVRIVYFPSLTLLFLYATDCMPHIWLSLTLYLLYLPERERERERYAELWNIDDDENVNDA